MKRENEVEEEEKGKEDRGDFIQAAGEEDGKEEKERQGQQERREHREQPLF